MFNSACKHLILEIDPCAHAFIVGSVTFAGVDVSERTINHLNKLVFSRELKICKQIARLMLH